MAKSKKKRLWRKAVRVVQGAGRLVFGFILRCVPFAVAVGLWVVLGLGVKQLLYADTSLAVRRVLVEPQQALTRDRLERLESRYRGRNILQVDLKAIAAELETDPHIKRARVGRRFPMDLVIQLEERRPIALIRFSRGGRLALIAEDGVLLEIPQRAPASYVLVNAWEAGVGEPRVGSRPKVRGWPEVVAFLKAFESHPLASRERIQEIRLDRLGHMAMNLAGGPEIRLGRDPAGRMKALEKIAPLLETTERQKIQYLDLQFADVIAKRKKGS